MIERRESPAGVASSDVGLADFGLDERSDVWLDELRDAEAPLPFGFVGPYELCEEISRGGQGVVYRARQPGTNRPVAVKRLLAGAFATPAMRRRFEREVEVLASLNHPNVVTAFSMDMVDRTPLLAMEWIDGRPITRWAEGENGARRTPREIVEMFLKVCDAVHHAHQHGVIHRDLKPSNVLIDGAGEPHVLDFGLAKLVGVDGVDSRLATVTEHFVGTLKYASPEQLGGEPGNVDVRTDVYALGVILYEMLTGRMPYEFGEGLAAAARAIEQSEPVRPSTIVEILDRDLEAITLKALAKDKSGRYQSTDALAEDLRRYLSGDDITARPAGGFRGLIKSVRRHHVAVAFTATVFALLAAFAVVVGVLAFRLSDQVDVAVAAEKNESQARTRAESEASRATAMRAFWEDILTSIDPMQGRDRDVTVREVMNAAVKQIETESSVQTADRAAMHLVIARTYQSLGLVDPAEPQYRAALAAYRQVHGDDHPDVLVAMTELGTLLHSKGDQEGADAFAEDSLALYKKLLAEGYPLLDVDLNAPAAWLCRKRDYDGAKALYREALAAHQRMFGERHPSVLDDMSNLSGMLVGLGEYDEAAELGRRILALRRELVGDEHVEVADDLYSLAATYNFKGDYEASESYYRQALAMRRRLLGDSHELVQETLYYFGIQLHHAGKLDEAESTLREALALNRKRVGDEHDDVAFCRWRLARLLLDRQEFAEAADLLRAALKTWHEVRPKDHWRTAYAESELGACLTGLGRYEEAEPLLVGSLAKIESKRNHGHGPNETIKAVQRIVDLYEVWGRPDKADEYRAKLPPQE